MKKILLAFGLLLSTFTYSQVETTQEEYNYITKGLIKTKTEGQSFKPGYKLGDLLFEEGLKWGDGTSRTVGVYRFLKGSTPVAFALDCKGSDGSSRYMCIPSYASSDAIWEQWFTEMQQTGTQWNILFLKTFAKISAIKL